MRQIKTKNIQIPLKSDSFKPFLKLILFNDKMCYFNRWLVNCKINQYMVRSTKLAIGTGFLLFCLLLSVYCTAIHKFFQSMTPAKFLSFCFPFLQRNGSICPTPEFLKSHQKALLFNKQDTLKCNIQDVYFQQFPWD